MVIWETNWFAEGDISLTDMLLMSYLFIFILCLYMIKVGDAFTEMSPFETKWDEQKSI